MKTQNIQLIVMGTKGAKGATGFFMGSNTANITQKIKNCPVLAVPEEFDVERSFDITYQKEVPSY